MVVQVNYTAREAGNILRTAAKESTTRKSPADGLRLFDVRRDFPDAWALLNGDLRHDEKGHLVEPHKRTKPELRHPIYRNTLPFLPGRCSVSVVRLRLFVRSEEGTPAAGSHVSVKYYSGGHQHHDKEDNNEDGRGHTFDYVSHDKRPGMYHGVTDLEVEAPSVTRGNQEVGLLRFPEGLGKLREIYTLCQSKAKDQVSTQTKGTCYQA